MGSLDGGWSIWWLVKNGALIVVRCGADQPATMPGLEGGSGDVQQTGDLMLIEETVRPQASETIRQAIVATYVGDNARMEA